MITATSSNNVAGTASVTVTPLPAAANVVISQIYGGGGNSGAPFTNDYVELFNADTQVADVTGWTIQYAPATSSTFTGSVTLPSATIQPGHYYLVQLASQAEPPLRWPAGADAVETFEKKAKELLAQASAHRALSSSLAHDDASK